MNKTINKRKTRVDLIGGPVFKNLLFFAGPILLGTIVTQLYHVADSVIVGQFVGSEALAAVSAGGPVMSLIQLFMIGLSSGSTVAIAQRAGAGNKKALQSAVGTIAFLTLVCSAFITCAGLLLCRPLLQILGTPPEIVRDSYLYLVIIYLGVTGNLCYNMGNGVLQGMGDSTWPFLFLLLCSGLNVGLDLVAVLILGWGVPGVAAATSFSQLVSGIGVVWRINSGDYGIEVKLKTIRPDKKAAGDIIAIGLPAAIQNIGNSIAALCVQSSVNHFGTDFIAANSVVVKVDDLICIPVMALSTALCTFVGQNMGVFRLDRIKKGINSCILSLTVLGVGLCLILIRLRGVLPLIFSSNPEVVSIASKGLFIMSFQCIFFGVDRCLVNAMRGAGKAVVPMITAQFGAFSRIPLAYLLGVRREDSMGIFYALLIAAFLRMAAIGIYYYGGGWTKAVRHFEEKHRIEAD